VNTWTERISKGEAWEALVLRKLNESGYQARMYGQGVISDLSAGLQAANSPIRHDPDLILQTPHGTFGIDCKYGRTDTSNHAVQLASIEGLQAWQTYSNMDVLLAFNHFQDRIGFMPLSQWRETARTGPQGPNGSGTPYELAVCRCAFPDGLQQPQPGELQAVMV